MGINLLHTTTEVTIEILIECDNLAFCYQL